MTNEPGSVIVNGSLMVFGERWERQRRAVSDAACRVMREVANGGHVSVLFVNRATRYVAFSVERSDGSTDFYTVSPSGHAAHYIVTVTPEGEKVNR